jgi:hypothetical protein
VIELAALGVTPFGTTATAAILDDLAARHRDEVPATASADADGGYLSPRARRGRPLTAWRWEAPAHWPGTACR